MIPEDATIVVVTNKNTASSSELTAAALRDAGR